MPTYFEDILDFCNHVMKCTDKTINISNMKLFKNGVFDEEYFYTYFINLDDKEKKDFLNTLDLLNISKYLPLELRILLASYYQNNDVTSLLLFNNNIYYEYKDNNNIILINNRKKYIKKLNNTNFEDEIKKYVLDEFQKIESLSGYEEYIIQENE